MCCANTDSHTAFMHGLIGGYGMSVQCVQVPISYRPLTPIVLPFHQTSNVLPYVRIYFGVRHFIACCRCLVHLSPHHPRQMNVCNCPTRGDPQQQKKNVELCLRQQTADWSGYQKTRCQKGSVLRSVTDWIDWEGLRVNINYILGTATTIKHGIEIPGGKLFLSLKYDDNDESDGDENDDDWRRCQHCLRHHSISKDVRFVH